MGQDYSGGRGLTYLALISLVIAGLFVWGFIELLLRI